MAGKFKLTTLKPRLAVLNTTRLQPVNMSGSGSPGRRWNGRKLTEWRGGILANEPLCRHCAEKGITAVAEDVDHIIPLENGGEYSVENACPLCKPCHKAKTAKDRGYKPKRAIGPDGWPV